MGTFAFFPFDTPLSLALSPAGRGDFLIGGLTWLVFIVALGLIAFWAIRTLASPHAGRWSPAQIPQPPSGPAPLDILARRFAAGEISAEEYQKAREVLAGTPKP